MGANESVQIKEAMKAHNKKCSQRHRTKQDQIKALEKEIQDLKDQLIDRRGKLGRAYSREYIEKYRPLLRQLKRVKRAFDEERLPSSPHGSSAFRLTKEGVFDEIWMQRVPLLEMEFSEESRPHEEDGHDLNEKINIRLEAIGAKDAVYMSDDEVLYVKWSQEHAGEPGSVLEWEILQDGEDDTIDTDLRDDDDGGIIQEKVYSFQLLTDMYESALKRAKTSRYGSVGVDRHGVQLQYP